MRPILPCLLSTLPTLALADAPKVVTDIAPIHSLVEQVMAGVGEAEVLVTGGASPHDFQFTFDQAEQVQDADLVVWVGPTLTPWLEEALETLAPETAMVTLLEAEDWPSLELRTGNGFGAHDHDHGHDDHDDHDHEEHDHDKDDDHDEHDHAEHDEHEHDEHDAHDHDEHARDDHGYHGDEDTAEVDPHAWLDPRVASAWVTIIANTLSEMDPDNAATYATNAATAQADLKALEAEIATELAAAPAGEIVVPHDAYQYFGNRFDRLAIAAVAINDTSAPSPDTLMELQELIANDNVTCVMSDPQTRGAWTDVVREGSAAGTAEADPIGFNFELGPDHYRATLLGLTDAYVTCLGG